MLGSDNKEHYGDVWPLTGHLWEGVCECGYKATVQVTPVKAARLVESHLAACGIHGQRVQIHEYAEAFPFGIENHIADPSIPGMR